VLLGLALLLEGGLVALVNASCYATNHRRHVFADDLNGA